MMVGMNMIELPSYLTVGAAAVRAGVDPSTVLRWVKDDKLPVHIPMTGARERPTLLLWAPDVDKFCEARRLVAGVPTADVDPCAGGRCPDPEAHAEGGHDV